MLRKCDMLLGYSIKKKHEEFRASFFVLLIWLLYNMIPVSRYISCVNQDWMSEASF